MLSYLETRSTSVDTIRTYIRLTGPTHLALRRAGKTSKNHSRKHSRAAVLFAPTAVYLKSNISSRHHPLKPRSNKFQAIRQASATDRARLAHGRLDYIADVLARTSSLNRRCPGYIWTRRSAGL